MKHIKIFVLSHVQIVFLTCILLFLTVTPFSASAKIVFCDDGDIFVMNDNGRNKRRLTKNTVARDFEPRWSPDGTRIAFRRNMDKKRTQTSGELFIMNEYGTDLQRLTDDDFGDFDPSWSPDGTRIAFTSKRSGKFEVHTIDVATRNITQLTGREGELSSGDPNWSPDGTKIVYTKTVTNGPVGFAHNNIYVMSADGKNQRPLFPDPKAGEDLVVIRAFPRWSSDGKRIALADCVDNGDVQTCHISIARIADKQIHVVQGIYDKELGEHMVPGNIVWMENDRALLFPLKIDWWKPNAYYDLYKYDFTTRRLTRLTDNPRNEKDPDWIEGALSVSPQGKLPTQWGEKKQNISQ